MSYYLINNPDEVRILTFLNSEQKSISFQVKALQRVDLCARRSILKQKGTQCFGLASYIIPLGVKRVGEFFEISLKIISPTCKLSQLDVRDCDLVTKKHQFSQKAIHENKSSKMMGPVYFLSQGS